MQEQIAESPELTGKQLCFLVLLQHMVSEDCVDVTRPERLRKHQDVFEGVLTDSISSQLVEDVLQVEGQQEERKRRIAQFQSELVHALETYLLSYAKKGYGLGDGPGTALRAATGEPADALFPLFGSGRGLPLLRPPLPPGAASTAAAAGGDVAPP